MRVKPGQKMRVIADDDDTLENAAGNGTYIS
jgi:hypothetical protein